LDGTSEPYESVESMAADYVRSIGSIQPQGPYLIAGYSGGGTVAFEIGRQLQASGEGVAEIIFLDSFSPGGGPAPSLTTRERLEVHLERFRKDGFGYLGGRLIERAKRGAEALSRSLSSPPPPPEPAPLSLYRRAAENWASIEARYEPQPSPLHAVLFRVKQSDAGEERLRRQQYGAWAGLTLEGLDEYIVPGTHVSMCEEPNVRVLARKLNRVLESATPRF
jgi:thioesterase domain-containing protein